MACGCGCFTGLSGFLSPYIFTSFLFSLLLEKMDFL